jgi:hypothetical protein
MSNAPCSLKTSPPPAMIFLGSMLQRCLQFFIFCSKGATKILVDENTVMMVFLPGLPLATFIAGIPLFKRKSFFMRRLTLFSITMIGIISLLFTGNGCSKSSDSSSANNNNSSAGTTAQAAYDSQSGGVYKGTLTGSSGYFVVNLQASKPYLLYQWTDPVSASDSLTAASLNNWQNGQAISKALFTGASGTKFWFSVGANGNNPVMDSVYFPNHTGPVYVAIGKETSSSPIKVYQGTATPLSSNGGKCLNAIVNIWTGGGMAMGSYLVTNGYHGSGTGTVSGNSVQITIGDEGGNLAISSDANSISGTVNGNYCSHTIAFKRIF